MLIYINGISTSGKSFIGNLLTHYLNHSVTIDQDTYYRTAKPTISFTNDKNKTYTVSNWDTIESIDFDRFNRDIKHLQQQYDYVIVTGFALRKSHMCFVPDLSILLNVNDMDIVIKNRRLSKRLTTDKYERDEWMVKKVVWPFYQETLTQLYPYYNIDVYENRTRVDKNIIINQILKLIQYL